MGAELVVGIKSRFDAAGAEAATKGLQGVVGAAGRAGNAAKKLGSDFVDLEIKHRRIESATRVLGTEFANMGRSGFTMAAAAESGASAISLLGNSVRFASGPIGIAVTVATALASALLMWSANAKTAAVATHQLATGVEALGFAQQILEARVKGVSTEAINHIKNLQQEATDTANITKLTEGRKEVADKYVETMKAQAAAQAALNQAEASRPKNVSGVKETDYEKASYGNAKLAEALADAAKKTNAAKGELDLYDASIQAVTASLEEIEEPADSLAGDLEHQAYLLDKLGVEDWPEYGASALDTMRVIEAAEAELTQKQMAMRALAFNTAASALGTLATFAEAAAGSELEVVKGLRAAEAVINGIAAGQQAVATYGPTPLGYAVAAVAVAGGIAAATQIMSTQRGSASASAPAVPSFGGSQGPSANPSPVGSNVGAAPAAPGYSGQRGGFSGTMNLTFNMQVNVLDPDAINNATLRRLGRRMAEIILFEINALGGTVSWQ